MAPEGASRCRAVAAGLSGRSAVKSLASYESERNLVTGFRTVNRGLEPVAISLFPDAT